MSDGAGWLTLASGLLKTSGKLRAGRQDSDALMAQSRTAFAQGYADEEVQRRQSRALLGEQAAAIAQAGIGPGGTAALVQRQSEINAEMDALNYRYRGTQQGLALRRNARSVRRNSYKMAGAQLLSSAAEYRNQRSILQET